MSYSYSTRQGFSRLKLTDHTDGLSHTGTIIFIPPSDMAKQTLEGQEAYWIQIADEKDIFKNSVISNPVINDIGTNAIEVDNIMTLEESEYYIDIYEANMSFAINARNILSVDVWVNETNSFSGNEIKRMLLDMPEETKAEYNFLGEIEEFYVKWQEVSNFDLSKPNDRHFIVDRMNNMIHFGDGVNVRIPKNTNGIAFKIVTRCCDGAVANVGRNQISGAFGNMMFIDTISNSIQAFGGMDMETMDEALQRGTTLLNGRNRLVSAMDYEREVLNFSHRISQVKTVIGQKKNGEYDPEVITIVVLMDDYKEGQQSFINIRRQLKEHLMSRCELSVEPSKLEIVEPVFAEVSVEAWIKVLNIDDTFEIQNTLTEALNNYLDPIKNDCWEIGRLVNQKQIELKLNIEKKNALIQKTQMTVSYKDLSGKHENDLNEFSNNPYVLVTSGKHKIHFQ